jgi:phage gp29-like protein
VAARKRKAAEVGSAELTDTLIADESVWRRIIGSGPLTPDRVTNACREADLGRPARLVDLVHELRQKAGEFQSVMQSRELAVSGLQWDIVAPEGAKQRDKKAAAQCKKALREARDFVTAIGHWTGEGNAFGHATVEQIWRVTEDNQLWPKLFKPINCRRFGFRISDGALLYDDSGLGSVEVDGVDLVGRYGAGKFLQWRPRVNGDVAPREGYSRVLAWLGLFSNWCLGDWAQLAELGWKPKSIGKYPRGTKQQDIDVLKRMLTRINSTRVGVIPDEMSIAMEWAKVASSGNSSVHREFAEFIGRRAAQVVLGQASTFEPGPNGDRASTTVRDQIRRDLREADCVGISDMVTRGYCRSFTDFNYGTRVQTPIFFFLTEDPLDLKAFSESIERLRKSGLRIPESYVHDRTGIPVPKADDILLGDKVDENGKRVETPQEDPNDGEADDERSEDREQTDDKA